MDTINASAQLAWAYLQPVLTWLSGPFWAFMNTPFVAGLIPAIVGLLLTRRVAEVAEANKDAAAMRAAEAQVHDLERAEEHQEASSPSIAVESVAVSAPTPVVAPTIQPTLVDDPDILPDNMVTKLDEKIESIKIELRRRIAELDGRKRRKYEGVPLYDYRPVTLMLARDGALSDKEAYTLVEIFSVWTRYRLKKSKLPQEKAKLILDFDFQRKHKRSRSTQTSEGEPTPTPLGAMDPSG